MSVMVTIDCDECEKTSVVSREGPGLQEVREGELCNGIFLPTQCEPLVMFGSRPATAAIYGKHAVLRHEERQSARENVVLKPQT